MNISKLQELSQSSHLSEYLRSQLYICKWDRFGSIRHFIDRAEYVTLCASALDAGQWRDMAKEGKQ